MFSFDACYAELKVALFLSFDESLLTIKIGCQINLTGLCCQDMNVASKIEKDSLKEIKLRVKSTVAPEKFFDGLITYS